VCNSQEATALPSGARNLRELLRHTKREIVLRTFQKLMLPAIVHNLSSDIEEKRHTLYGR
jgi:hypothetical protein